MWKSKVWAFSLALMCLGLMAAPEVQAHKLLVSTVDEGGGSLKVQAFFPDGRPAQEVPVSVTGAGGRPPVKGQTDQQGICLVPGLAPGQYRVEVGDPLGHRAEARVALAGSGDKVSQAVGPQPGRVAVGGSQPPPGEPIPWGNVLAGLGFIFGATALIMVMQVRREVRRHASGD